ncbi:MAG: UDP-N-acetylmuramoyl-tripeptide--D-alanyl-D-alanine ligase [SAR324 cluster bacterium]|nr:UDP-N-acetylmuramoyl-tripeptide--D-alanyl-D-alanine ligase [SAR324 cluster bacterium]
MMEYSYTLHELCLCLNGTTETSDSNLRFNACSIDTRTLNTGDIFFCISGETTDGHLYVANALEKGAALIVGNRSRIPRSITQLSIPLIHVEDPNRAFLDLAADYRKRFQGTVIGVTGSNGKTSTKEILKGLCQNLDPTTHATAGNFNNHIGVPLTLLSAPLSSGWWVVEMGTNHFGEIETLTQVVRPNVGILTSIGESHLEFFDTTEGVAHEKSSMFNGMQPGSVVVFPAHIKHRNILEQAAQRQGIQIRTCGFEALTEEAVKATILNHADETTIFELWGTTFETSLVNPLLLLNLLGCLVLLQSCGVSIPELQQAVKQLKLSVKGRIHTIPMKDWTLVDDTYNANPSSFQSVVSSLKHSYPERRLIVVAGKMAELGQHSMSLHLQTGQMFYQSGISMLLACGDNESQYYLDGWKNAGGSDRNSFHAGELEDLFNYFQNILRPADIVLVKGSRAARMENFVKKCIESLS